MNVALEPAKNATKKAGFGVFRGIRYPFRGARFVYREHPGLARIWIFPILLTAIAAIGAIAFALAMHGRVIDAVWPLPAEGQPAADVAMAARGFFDVLFAFALAGAGLVLATMLSTVFAAPFSDLLSEAVEVRVRGVEFPPFRFRTFARDAFRSLRIEAAKVAVYALVMGTLFLVGLLVPVLGHVVSAILGFLFTTIYLAMDYTDWPAARAGHGFRARVRFVADHFLTLIGFGAGVWLFLCVPLINLLFMPAAVAGGTLLYFDLTSRDAGDRRQDDRTQGEPA